MSELTPWPERTPSRERRIALVDLLDRLLAGGVVITGDITISIANVDLVRVSLRALVASIRSEMALPAEEAEEPYDAAYATYTVYEEDSYSDTAYGADDEICGYVEPKPPWREPGER